MARKKMVAGNWKMNKTSVEAAVFAQDLVKIGKKCGETVDIVIVPPFTAIRAVSTVINLDRLDVKLAAQNMYYEPDGAYTGEISPAMLKAERVDYVILGHSERRGHFGESDEMVNLKAKAAFAHALLPIICCGESLEIREAEETGAWISDQIAEALAGLTARQVSELVIAYEPIWAIGTGHTATPDMAQEICALIRALVTDLYDESVADAIRILYGGSVNEHNAHLFFAQPDIDGALVGGAALDLGSFMKIVKAAC